MLQTKTVAKANNLAHLRRDRGYRFTDRDPDMEWLCDIIEKSGLHVDEITQRILDVSNKSITISPSTINNWLNGKTRRPQNFTLTWVAHALGYERQWVKTPKKD